VHVHDDPLGLGDDWYETSPLIDTRHPDARTADAQPVHLDEMYEPPGETPYDDSSYEYQIPEMYEDAAVHDQADFVPAGTVMSRRGGNASATPPRYSVFSQHRKRLPDAGPAGNPARLMEALRDVIASVHGKPAAQAAAIIGRIRASGLLERLDDDQALTYTGILEVLAFEAGMLDGVGVIDFEYLPAKHSQREQVRDELDVLHTKALSGDMTPNPMKVLEAVIEDVQAGITRQKALAIVEAIDLKLPATVKMDRFRELKSAPPTRQQTVKNNTWAKSAGEWTDERRAMGSGANDIILATGYPSLDVAASGSAINPGLVKPGEFWIGAAGTGHGKSAFTRRVFSSMLQDLTHGYGYRKARGILAITEEEAWDVASAAMLDRGQRFHHLAANAIIAKVGESFARVIQVVYDSVAEADMLSQSTGEDITEFLPYFYMLDYIQGVKVPGLNPDTDGLARVADLMMRGIAAWDPEMMASISGLDYREYTGMDWPSGIEHHRVAVFVLSQLRKEGNDHNVFFRKGKSAISDFVVVDSNGTPLWEPREDDYAIPNRSDLRGSGVLLNHATGLVFFHRSRPTASITVDPATGKKRLTDTRARFIVPKARKSVAMPFIPMRFDSNPDGFRGQFYDDLGHKHVVEEARMQITDAYQQLGDPMLPVRPSRNPFTVRY
jgi:hypothetical protein